MDNLFHILPDLLHKPVAIHCFHTLMFSTVSVEPPVENMVAPGAIPLSTRGAASWSFFDQLPPIEDFRCFDEACMQAQRREMPVDNYVKNPWTDRCTRHV
ncbi:hypothetical protein [Pseudomonas sp. SMV7]|uniref:hypothetical protein n=1 Tax=Pseudomonas sp. SMV7 TaxID=3390194 RepID=UPI003F831CC8